MHCTQDCSVAPHSRSPACAVSSYLPDTMLYLLSCLKRDRERSAAFQAIGLLAVSVQQDINPHLPRIMEVIRASLPSKDMPQKYVNVARSLLCQILPFTYIHHTVVL